MRRACTGRAGGIYAFILAARCVRGHDPAVGLVPLLANASLRFVIAQGWLRLLSLGPLSIMRCARIGMTPKAVSRSESENKRRTLIRL